MNMTPNTIAIVSLLEKFANTPNTAGNLRGLSGLPPYTPASGGISAALNAQNTLTRSTLDKKDITPTMSNPNPPKQNRINNFSYAGVKPLYNSGNAGTMTNRIADPIKTPNFLV